MVNFGFFSKNIIFDIFGNGISGLALVFLNFFEKHKFPMGTMNLRKFSWSLKFLSPADTYKIEIISEMIDAYPLRKYICVGDSGSLFDYKKKNNK